MCRMLSFYFFLHTSPYTHIHIQVVRRVENYVQDAEFEVSILEKVAHLDVRSSYTVQLYKFFHYHGHFCIVTELLGESLHAALKLQRNRRYVFY